MPRPEAVQHKPLTRKEAFEQWASDAYARTAKVTRLTGKVNESIRKIIQEGKLRGQTEKRLARDIEDLEDAVGMLFIMLLGPDVSQEERDADR
jgi:hypothetical protein